MKFLFSMVLLIVLWLVTGFLTNQFNLMQWNIGIKILFVFFGIIAIVCSFFFADEIKT